ncbi:hypothetical protein DRQ50_03285 [bacterium]|nr:MAG: hypothetical protein DRQ50_03285 [bacterium]
MTELKHWQTLADALLDEDRILRRRITTLPSDLLAVHGPEGALSFQETLAHIAYWDDFTVKFFSAKLDPAQPSLEPPGDFMDRSEAVINAAAELPFTDVLARYLEATGALVGFISRHWDELNEKERRDFWVPLKHRRHHRIALFRSLDLIDGVIETELASGA